MTRADRCPGVLRPHVAQDGAVVRIRIPGGQTTGTAIGRLSRIAQEFGNRDIQLTSRASVQLRGLPDPVPQGLIDAVRGAGFLPSDTHERVRNIVASPLTGVSGGVVDVRPLVGQLNAGICADTRLAALPSRFLFALDDGRGDVSGAPFDLGYRAVDHDYGWVLLGGPDLGIPVATGAAVETLLDLGRQFLAVSEPLSDVWHVHDLPRWVSSLRQVRTIALPRWTAGTPLGNVAGAASVHVPLGLLTPAQAGVVEACAAEAAVITPSRGLVLPGAGGDLASLVATGLIDDPASPWSAISACVGAPSCQKSLINTRAYATTLARFGSLPRRTHISGCERCCGAPAGDHIDLVVPDNFQILATIGEAQ